MKVVFLGIIVLGALLAGAIGLGAVAFDDLDGAISGGGTQASLIDIPNGAAPRSSIEASGFNASAGALADFETPTATPTPTSTSTRTPTATPSPTATEVPLEPTAAVVVEAAPTDTPVPPTDTPPPPADTPVPPTATPVPPTVTPVPPTAAPTLTPTLAVPENVPLLGQYVPPTATPTPIATATATETPSPGPNPQEGPDGLVAAYATRYADSLEGNTMACGGVFDQDDAFVIAVSLNYDQAWKCGTQLEVCGPAGCMIGVRTDTCPGCPGADIDLSRAGLQFVCGNQTGCNVVIRRL